MLSEAELLEDGESIIGRYTVEIARESHGELISTIPALYLGVTNRRIIMLPQVRKQHPPASIYGGYIRRVETLKHERSGACIILKNDYEIRLFVGRLYTERLINEIRQLAALPAYRPYNAPIDNEALNKLIEFFEGL